MRARAARPLAFALGALVLAGSVLGLAASAQAHNYLVESTPVADSTLTELPESFEIVTNDNLLVVGDGAGGFALQVRDADGLYYGDGCVEVAGPAMSAVPALGAAGVYRVLWQVVSADGHTVSDEYTFTWAPTAPDAEVASGSAEPPVCGQPQAGASEATGDEATGGAGASEEPQPSQTDPGDTVDADASASGSDSEFTDVLWIGGAVIAIAVAVVVTLLVLGRRKQT